MADGVLARAAEPRAVRLRERAARAVRRRGHALLLHAAEVSRARAPTCRRTRSPTAPSGAAIPTSRWRTAPTTRPCPTCASRTGSSTRRGRTTARAASASSARHQRRRSLEALLSSPRATDSVLAEPRNCWHKAGVVADEKKQVDGRDETRELSRRKLLERLALGGAAISVTLLPSRVGEAGGRDHRRAGTRAGVRTEPERSRAVAVAVTRYFDPDADAVAAPTGLRLEDRARRERDRRRRAGAMRRRQHGHDLRPDRLLPRPATTSHAARLHRQGDPSGPAALRRLLAARRE